MTMATEQPPQSTRTLLRGIWGHLSRRRRIQLGLLLVVMLANGLAELVSLGAVLPFLAVLSDPEQLWQQPLIQALAARVGFTATSHLLLPVPAVDELLSPLLKVITMLLLRHHIAAHWGLDVDQPRNLAKSITVE